MDHDLAQLGAALKATRVARRPKLTQEEVASNLGVSRATVQNIERGVGFSKVTPTIRAYAHLLDWTADSIDRVLAGGEPGLVHDASASPRATSVPPAKPSRLPLRVVDEIESSGALVDTAVIPLGDGGNMVVIVTGKEDATPEERQRNLDAWRQAQQRLQELSHPGRSASPDANGS
ncbi:helix-turn-helix transcriptional regulator [Streptomyces flavidovirens]|uniref:helix-turn-helix transcriptional regulator n=1 Tax=Streptomyces flavidovirens TaxID=67298 RepID=UPI0036C95F1A